MWRDILAIVIGLGGALTATDPLNTVNARLDLLARPWLAVLSPAVLVAVLALLAGALFHRSDRRRVPLGLAAGAGLLCVAGLVSTVASAQPTHSALLYVECLLAPGLMLLGIWWSDLPRRLLAAAWLLGVVLLFLRADAVFLALNGLPTPHTLFEVKYSNVPYDFHYYTLGNPNSTTAFLVLPLVLALLWSRDVELSLGMRRMLAAVSLFLAANMVLVFTRTGIAIVVVLGLLALWGSSRRRDTRIWLVILALVCVGAFDPTLRTYFSDLAQRGHGSSAQVRLTTIENGIQALGHRPLSGFGLGQRGTDVGFNPAHSAVVQTGAETGIAGAIGIALVMVSICFLAVRIGRRDRWRGLPAAGVCAAGMFAVLSAVAGSAAEWLGSDSTAAWGLGLAVTLSTLSASPQTESLSAPAQAAVERARRLAWRAGPRLRPWTGGLAVHSSKVLTAALVFAVAIFVAQSPGLSSRLYSKFPQYGPVLQRLPLRGPGPLYDAPVDSAAIHRAATIIGGRSTYYVYEPSTASPGLSSSLRAAGLLFFGPAIPVASARSADWVLSYQAGSPAPADVHILRRYQVGPGIYVLRVAPS